MACKCFEENKAELIGKYKERIADTSYVEDSLKAEWAGEVFYFVKGDFAPITLRINFERQPIKKNGELMKNRRKEEFSVAVNYCPFCGTKFEGAEKEAEAC